MPKQASRTSRSKTVDVSLTRQQLTWLLDALNSPSVSHEGKADLYWYLSRARANFEKAVP